MVFSSSILVHLDVQIWLDSQIHYHFETSSTQKECNTKIKIERFSSFNSPTHTHARCCSPSNFKRKKKKGSMIQIKPTKTLCDADLKYKTKSKISIWYVCKSFQHFIISKTNVWKKQNKKKQIYNQWHIL